MVKETFYDGILYQIEYKPMLSQRTYTQRIVYRFKKLPLEIKPRY